MQAKATISGGNPLPTGQDNKSFKVEEAVFRDDSKLRSSIRIKAAWEWGKVYQGSIPVEPLVKVHSAHFEIESPKPWRWQAQNYLNMLERTYQTCRVLTGRLGPSTVNVDWRHSPGGAAKASIGKVEGRQKRLWMSLPFQGFRDCWSQFSEPANGGGNPYLTHETLHLFGYQHGQEMTRLELIGEWFFSRSQWYLHDHPKEALNYVTLD